MLGILWTITRDSIFFVNYVLFIICSILAQVATFVKENEASLKMGKSLELEVNNDEAQQEKWWIQNIAIECIDKVIMSSLTHP